MFLACGGASFGVLKLETVMLRDGSRFSVTAGGTRFFSEVVVFFAVAVLCFFWD